MPNPNTAQGVLNRVSALLTFATTGTLFAVTPDLLGREGIRLTLEGNATDYFPTMTGAVPSPAPFQIATLTIALLKTQPQSDTVKNRFELNTLLGQCTIQPDVPAAGSPLGTISGNTGLGKYTLMNCVLESVNAMSFAGEDPTWVVTIKGYYEVNSLMFNT
jgi:hypothetical protein